MIYDLYSLDQLAIIMLHEHGLTYTNQTGGYACHHPEAVGSLILLDIGQYVEGEWRKIYKDIQDHFTGPKWGGWCSTIGGEDGSGIDEETAEFLDKKLYWGGFYDTSVCRELLNQSEEAWIHVEVGDKPGILTWSNSD